MPNNKGNDIAEKQKEAARQESERQALIARSKSLGIAYLDSRPNKINNAVVNIIPVEVSKKFQIVAFEKEGNIIKVAMVDPQNIEGLNALRFISEKEKVGFDIFLTSEKVFEDMTSLVNNPSDLVKEAVASFREDSKFEFEEGGAKKQEEKEEILKEAPVAKLVEVIISHAIEGKASDIHIEPLDNNYRVRFRVDGILHLSLIFPNEIGPAIISRIKILSNLKIDEKRKPQDGRFRLKFNGREVDFRVSSLPVIEGEKIVMRILDKEEGLTSIESLGLLGNALGSMELAIKETYGMILITGPTGSGKSTSLYALLKILNNEERNIITLEDPIEYKIEGLNQSQIKPEIGYTFASGLRSILRQDPNVIMVGEIRDSETAELAVHAALTGHLMFSTLHTNTALGAIPRLIDMGIEPFLLSSSLRLVVSQRLVRKICNDCRKVVNVSESVRNIIEDIVHSISLSELEKYEINPSEPMNFYHGAGCNSCNGTGLKGRLAIYEVIPVNNEIKYIITEKKGAEDLLIKERERMGLMTIKQDGILKIIKGLTTIEEVERVTEGNITLAEEND
jgi:type IV pilus assembly protein PilB